MVARIKKDDTVIVLSGKDKGVQGSVIKVSPKKKGKLLVKGVAIATKHIKARGQEPGGIKKVECFVDPSRVMPICPACNNPCRVNSKTREDGKRVRMCNKCKESF